jgi:sugar phosphate isomerase/epimerase
MKYSVLERTVPSENGTVDTFHDAGTAGFDGISLQIDGPDPTTHLSWSPEGRAKLRRAAVESGVEVASLCPSFYWQGWDGEAGLVSDDPSQRKKAMNALEHSIDAAGALSADTVLLPFFRVCELTEEKHKDRVIDALSNVADTAELIDVTITMETTLPAAENAQIVDAVDSPAVKICYDAANKVALYGMDALNEIELLGDRIGEYHVKDFLEPPPDFPDNYVPLGEGAVDQQAVASALQAVGYDGWAVLETEVDKELSYTADELDYTQSLFDDSKNN